MTVKYQNYLYRDFISETTGTKAVNVPITILISGTTTIATLFDDNGVEINNPVVTDNEAYYSFNIDAGSYDFIADYDQPEDNQDVIYEGKLIFSSTSTPDEKESMRSITLAQMKVQPNAVAGDVFTISDRNNAKYMAIAASQEEPANEIDIVSSSAKPELVFVYIPNEYIQLNQIGGVGDLSVGLMYNADGQPLNLLELNWYRFDTTQLLNDAGPNSNNSYTKAYLVSQNYKGTDKLPEDGVVENLTREQLWSRTKAACTDNAGVFARIPYLISKHKKPVYIGRNFFYSSSGFDLTKASFTPKIFGDDEFESVIATDSDDAFIEASNGLETEGFCLYGPAFRKTTADVIDKNEYLNSRGISTKTAGGQPGSQASNWKISHRSQGFKYDIWMRNSLWCDFSRFKGGGLCCIAAARNDFPDDQSNPDSPAGWNNFSGGGWFHNQNIYTGALLEAQEVGYFGCDTTSQFETITVQRQYVDNDDNRILPAGDRPTGIYLFAGKDGSRNAWGNIFGNIYGESCWRVIYMRDQVTSSINGIFTQGQAQDKPYDTPIELNNSVCKILTHRGSSQSFFRTDAILRNNSQLFGNPGAITTEQFDVDETSRYYLSGEQSERYKIKRLINLNANNDNQEFLLDDFPIEINSTFELTVHARYNGVTSFDYVDNYIVTYNDSNTPVVLTRVSRTNVGASADATYGFYSIQNSIIDGKRVLKLITDRPTTNPYALRIYAEYSSSIVSQDITLSGQPITANEPIIESFVGGQGGGDMFRIITGTAGNVPPGGNSSVITPANDKQRVVITSMTTSADSNNLFVLSRTNSNGTSAIFPSGTNLIGFNGDATSNNQVKIGSWGDGRGTIQVLEFEVGDVVTIANNHPTSDVQFAYKIEEKV